MAKDLPKMYQNKAIKSLDNIQKVYSTLYEHSEDMLVRNSTNIFTVEQKIYNIFKSPSYIYKADVVIETDDGTLNKRIVGKNRNSLITMDNEYIPIDKIKDIYFK